MEAKPFASLSSGLLARKGAARPAMRPQGFGQVGNGLEDLGWNDMGFEPPKPAEAARDLNHDAFGDDVVGHPRYHPTGLTPVQSPVHDQQAEIVERLGGTDTTDEEEIDETAELYELGSGAVEPQDPKFEEAPVQPLLAVKAPTEKVQPRQVPEGPVVPAAPVANAEPVGRAQRVRTAAGTKPKAAFTLRLDPDRHLKLRLACAVDGRSAQQLVTDALDQMLERMPELDGLAAKAKLRG